MNTKEWTTYTAVELDSLKPKPTDSPWKLKLSTLVLVHRPYPGRMYEYEVDLERCLTAAEVLNWILHIRTKTWATDNVLAGLVRSLAEVLDLYGRADKPLTKWEVRERAEQYALTHPENMVDEE